MVSTLPVFLSDAEAASLENKNGDVLTINVGKHSPFANLPPRDPWAINDSVVGVTPYDLWFGASRMHTSLAAQFAAGVEIVEWIVNRIERDGLDPFASLPQDEMPGMFFQYVAERKRYNEKVERSAKRASIHLVNGLYFVASQISLDPGVLSAQYGILPHNRVDFSVVYNPEQGKMSIGANTVGSMPHGSAAMIVYERLEEARRMYEDTQKVFLPTALNLDVLTAAMLAQGTDLPLSWIKYVEALKLGNFASRLNKRLPDLTPVGRLLTELDITQGKWGGSPTFQGSPRGMKTAITDPGQVLTALAREFPVAFEGIEPVRLVRGSLLQNAAQALLGGLRNHLANS